MMASLQEPSPRLPNPEPLAKSEEEEEQQKPSKVQQEEEEEEDEDSAKSKQKRKGQPEKGVPKNRISVTLYGAISGDGKCSFCVNAHKYFSNPQQWKKFHYKHIDIMSDKGMKAAEKQGISQMPFFRVRRPGERRDEWIIGFNQKEFEEMEP